MEVGPIFSAPRGNGTERSLRFTSLPASITKRVTLHGNFHSSSRYQISELIIHRSRSIGSFGHIVAELQRSSTSACFHKITIFMNNACAVSFADFFPARRAGPSFRKTLRPAWRLIFKSNSRRALSIQFFSALTDFDLYLYLVIRLIK